MGTPLGEDEAKPSVFERMNFPEVGQALLVTGLVLLVSAAVLLYAVEAKLQSTTSEVQRTTAALLRIEEIEALVIGVDYSARGYALTGGKMFLTHEIDKQARLKQAVIELYDVIRPSQRTAIKNLGVLAEKHAAVYAGLVSKGPGQVKEVAAVITDPVERKKRYDVMAVLSNLRQEEVDALTVEQADSVRQLRYTSLLTFIIVVVAFLGAMTDVMAHIWSDRRRRLRRAA